MTQKKHEMVTDRRIRGNLVSSVLSVCALISVRKNPIYSQLDIPTHQGIIRHHHCVDVDRVFPDEGQVGVSKLRHDREIESCERWHRRCARYDVGEELREELHPVVFADGFQSYRRLQVEIPTGIGIVVG